MQPHSALAALALAAMILLTGWSVVRSGRDFDPESFGIGAGALIFGGGSAGAGIVAARRWAEGSRRIDDPDR
jgi:hypothetical protein